MEGLERIPHKQLLVLALMPRRGTRLPAGEHVAWPTSQVFKGKALAS